jgi:hypothetical protein
MKFWYTQPVFHIYNLWYWLNPPGIIQHTLPNINKFTNLINIKTEGLFSLNKVLLERICNFIKMYYIQSEKVMYNPSKNNIIEYLSSCNNESYLTFYQKPKILFEKSEPMGISDDIIAVTSARPLNITFTLKGLKRKTFQTYYVDNLCVHPDYRKGGIAPQMIQTHYYNLRQKNKKIQTCLFKREGNLTAIVPLTTFDIFGYLLPTMHIMTTTMIKIIEIGIPQLPLFMDFIKLQVNKFKCIILPDISNIINLIKTDNIYIYGMIESGQLKSVYIFRNLNLFYDQKQAIECFLTINDNNYTIDFITGFNISLQKIQKEKKSKAEILLLEDTGHAHLLRSQLSLPILFTTPSAFFLYNYACYTIPNDKILLFY